MSPEKQCLSGRCDGYKYILFDLDGTLTDSAPGIIASLRYALACGGIAEEVIAAQDLTVFLGPPLRKSLVKYFDVSADQAEQLIAYYRQRFEQKGMFENRVYEGVPHLLAALKTAGKKILLATAKPEIYAKQILAHFQLLPFFDLVCGTTLDASRDSKAAVIDTVLTKLAIDKAAAVMIGDRHHDAEGAKENGIDCIGVLYGYGSAKELRAAGTRYLVASPTELEALLLTRRAAVNHSPDLPGKAEAMR